MAGPAGRRRTARYVAPSTSSTPGIARGPRNASSAAKSNGSRRGSRSSMGTGPGAGVPSARSVVACRSDRGVPVAAVAQLGRGDRVDLADRLVELAQAREAGRERDVDDGQVRGLQQRPRHARALRPGQRERRRAQVVDEDPPQLPLAVAQAMRQAGHALAVHEALVDEAHRAAGDVAAQVPLGGARRGARDAALARPEPGALRGRGRGVEADAVAPRGHGRAARPAVDAGGGDRREEVAVEAAIAAGDGAIVALEGGVGLGDRGRHALRVPPSRSVCSRESDIADRGWAPARPDPPSLTLPPRADRSRTDPILTASQPRSRGS